MRKSWPPQKIDGVPDRVVLIDGVCVLCSAAARFVIARDPAASFRFVTVQEPYGRALAQRLGIDIAAPETNAVVLGRIAYFKSDVAIEVLSRLRRRSWVRVFWILPRPVRNAVYDLVARNRYRLFGRTETCLVPTPELARHFLRDGASLG
jgi:predicted DCC family thiol-disulfide oxidoreductase YuxK